MAVESCISTDGFGRARLVSLSFIPICGLSLYVLFWGWPTFLQELHWLLVITIYVGSVFVHEYLHYLGFILFGGADRDSVEFKFNRKNLTPYVICKSITTVMRYKVAAVLPFLVVGIIPLIYGFIFHNSTVYVIGLLNVDGCSGDLVLYFLLSRLDNHSYVARHNLRIGFVVVGQKGA